MENLSGAPIQAQRNPSCGLSAHSATDPLGRPSQCRRLPRRMRATKGDRIIGRDPNSLTTSEPARRGAGQRGEPDSGGYPPAFASAALRPPAARAIHI